jgi:hypothetical protein
MRRAEAKHLLWFGLAALAPSGLLLALIVTYWVDVPFWDQWGTSRYFGELARGRLTLADLFHPQNEYRQFFPHLLFVGLGWLTRWDVRAEMLVSFLLACLVCLGVYRLGKLTAAGEVRQRLLAFVASALLIFSPVQYENWLFGIQVVYFAPLVCVVAALCVAVSGLPARVKFLLSALLATVSTFSSANGFLCWVVAAPALAVSEDFGRARRWRWAAAWAAGFAANVALYLHDLNRPNVYTHAPSAGDALVYFLAFTGGPLALGPRPLLIAVPFGAALVVLYAAAWLYVLRRRDAALTRRATAWLMLGAFSVLTGALVTYGRADDHGLRQALSSRYTTFSLYLIVALAHLTIVVVGDLRARGRVAPARLASRLAAAAAVALVLAHPLVTLLVARRGMAPARRERMYLKACLTFALAFEDDCAERLANEPPLVRREADSLDRLGYLRPPLVRSPRVADLPAGPDKAEGAFETLERDGGGRLVARGRARLPHSQKPADAVLLAYAEEGGEPVLFAVAEVGADAGGDGWRKSISLDTLPPRQISLSAWAFDSSAGKAFKLDGTHDVR